MRITEGYDMIDTDMIDTATYLVSTTGGGAAVASSIADTASAGGTTSSSLELQGGETA